MTHLRFPIALLAAVLLGHASAQSPRDPAETQYLLFQVWPRMTGYPGIPPLPGRLSLSREQMTEFARSLIKAIGTTGDARHKLGFAVGPFSFDVPDDETRQWIRDAFAAARENDVAVAIHIDDSMSWGHRKDLLSNSDNLETADWTQIPNKARSLQWGVKPTEFPPQMCYNAPAIVAAAKERAALIGAEIQRELAVLKSQGKEYLFAGVIAGSETQISPEFGTNRRLGFRALAHRGFSETNPPKDPDAERVSVVKEWIELWCNSLHAGGAPHGKIFCHIAFTDQGLRKPTTKESYVERVAFAPPEVAFSSAYRPGFSTYPEGQTFKEVYAALAAHGSPGWISAEGTNVSPTSMPGEPTMETYLGRIFNHGGVLANTFSWGIGGEAQRNNFFRKATENPEALAAYAKFLRGDKLVEAVAKGFSSTAMQDKMHQIQAGFPGWMDKAGLTDRLRAMWHMHNIQSYLKEKKWQELDKEADEVLALMSPPTKSHSSTAVAAGAQDEEARAHFLHELGGPFFVSRDKVQEELKLSDDQKHKLRETLTGYVQETMEVQKSSGTERKQAMQALRQKSYERLEAFLKETLTPTQFQRFAELKRQYDMPMIMLQPDIVKELNITDEQRQQFMSLIQGMQKAVTPLIQQSRSGGDPQEILARVTRLRLDCQGRIEALLSDTQKKQWKEMTGAPFVIW